VQFRPIAARKLQRTVIPEFRYHPHHSQNLRKGLDDAWLDRISRDMGLDRATFEPFRNRPIRHASGVHDFFEPSDFFGSLFRIPKFLQLSVDNNLLLI
jgi:hypothetical protein